MGDVIEDKESMIKNKIGGFKRKEKIAYYRVTAGWRQECGDCSEVLDMTETRNGTM